MIGPGRFLLEIAENFRHILSFEKPKSWFSKCEQQIKSSFLTVFTSKHTLFSKLLVSQELLGSDENLFDFSFGTLEQYTSLPFEVLKVSEVSEVLEVSKVLKP